VIDAVRDDDRRARPVVLALEPAASHCNANRPATRPEASLCVTQRLGIGAFHASSLSICPAVDARSFNNDESPAKRGFCRWAILGSNPLNGFRLRHVWLYNVRGVT